MDFFVRSMSAEDLAGRGGTELGVSEWIGIDQRMIDAFAELTGDSYFLHTDPQRAAATPFKGTIVHGFLTLAMLAQMGYQVVPMVQGSHTTVNYGFNKVRFIAPVPAGARIRGRFVLSRFESLDANRAQATYEVTVEIEHAAKPAVVAEWIYVSMS